jgi:hypothetical protein
MNKKDFLIKLHAYVSSDGMIDKWKCKEIRGNNIRIRKKFRVRFYNQEKSLINDFIDGVNKVYPDLKYIKYSEKRGEIDIRSQKLAKGIFGLGNISTKSWEFPKKLNRAQKRIWVNAFASCDGTVYNKNYNRYVAIDSINLKGLKKISRILKEFKILSSIYKVEYKENLSYRLRIYRKENLIRFNNLIGFKHPTKQKKLEEAIKSYKQKL